jgi:putative CocE/NonD family hydrolase
MRNVRIPVRDGTRLAADLFVPEPIGDLAAAAEREAAEPPSERFPALLEYLPYRKNDGTADRWNAHHYFAARGYVGVRLDVRGTGDSPGTATDEYTPQEQRDGCDAIAWLAAQPWCNGRVGMWGTSYGGFNAIQVAMHQPPALRAIAPHVASDDRYNDDVHYYGGCLTCLDLLSYPLMMLGMNALPPNPDYAGPEWAETWRQRLAAEPWLLPWLRHQTRDEYWRQGSLAADYAAIRCPVFHVGGWNDGYTNAVFRMQEHLAAPSKALVGPWTHSRPDVSGLAPRVDYLHELLRWWDYWLKDVDTGIMAEAPLTLYVQEGHPPLRQPGRWLEEIPGSWRYEREWPPARTRIRTLHLAGRGVLGEQPAAGAGSDAYAYDPTVGTAAGSWVAFEPPYGLAGDQQFDDVRSLTYDTPPLGEPLEILGRPRVVLYAASTAPVAFFVAKLCDVAPDGTSTLIARGALNATRRGSQESPEPLRPGEIYELAIQLKVTSWTVPASHRLRLSLSSADWPTIWPSPYSATNRVYYGPAQASRLLLPTVGVPQPALPAPRLRPPSALPATARGDSTRGDWSVARDEVSGAITVRRSWGYTTSPLRSPIVLHGSQWVEARVAPTQPDCAHVKGVQRFDLEQAGMRTQVTARASIQSTVDTLQVDLHLEVTHQGARFWSHHWQESIPRQLL